MTGLLTNPYISFPSGGGGGGDPLSYVGGTTQSFINFSSGTQAVDLTSLTGGTDSAPAEGDLVVVAFGIGGSPAIHPTINTSGYTEQTYDYGNDTYDTALATFTKIMGATPDTEVVVDDLGSAINAGVVCVHVWRNADQSTPMDVAAVGASGIDSGVPNPAAITPTTSGAIVLVVGASCCFSQTLGNSGELSNFIADFGNDTVDCSVGMGSYAWSSGEFDPAALSTGCTRGDVSWAAATLALRPANPS